MSIATSLRTITLVASVLAGAMAPAKAVDTEPSRDAPDLTVVRARIKARDFTAAIGDLNGLIEKGVQHADVYSLLGYSLRNNGDNAQAMTFYSKALEFDPSHKGALEYQGELFLKLGDIAKARQNADKLAKLCPQGCEELTDLAQAIAARSTAN
jgi:tetratricopeptide (TPR) repeat protein